MAKVNQNGIVKRGKSFRVYYWIGSKKIYKTLPKGTTLSDASAIRTQMILDSKNKVNAKPEPQNITLDDFFQNHLEEYGKVNWTPKWQMEVKNLYNRYIKNHNVSKEEWLHQAFGQSHLKDISVADISGLIAHMNNNLGLSNNSQLRAIAVLSKCLDRAFKQELIEKNPVKLIDKPSAEHKKFTPWDIDTLISFLDKSDAVASDPASTVIPFTMNYLFRFAVNSGLRRSELLGLQWKDIDWKNKTINLTRTVVPFNNSNITNGFQYGHGKTDGSLIPIPMTSEFENILKAIHGSQIEMKARIGHQYNNKNGSVFTDEQGNLYSPDRVTRTFARLISTWNLPKIKFHGLRHMTATLLINNGTDLKIVQEILRHATYQVTAETYSHIAPKTIRDEYNKISDLTKGTSIAETTEK